MKLSVEYWLDAFRKDFGKEPSERDADFIRYVDSIGQHFRSRGFKDAKEVKDISVEAVQKVVANHIKSDPEGAKLLAEIFYEYYKEGSREAAE